MIEENFNAYLCKLLFKDYIKVNLLTGEKHAII